MTRAGLALAFAYLALALAGCGQGASGSAEIELWSPAVKPDGRVAPGVRCGSGTLWLPLRWGKIPADAKELIIYFGRFAHADPQRPEALRVPFGAAFTKVALDARATQTNAFPPGETFPRYFEIANCAPKPGGQKYFAAIFAVGETAFVPDPIDEAFAKRITEEVLGFENPVTESGLVEGLFEKALAVGSLVATYGEPRR